MTAEESLRCFGLVPADDVLPEIRTLLAQEAEAERLGEPREDDLALLCSAQLFSRGFFEDVLRIWDAKSSSMDLGASLGVQLLCGAGLAETKRFLRTQDGDAAANALTYIEACERAGDFRDFSPSALLEDYKRYFQVD